MPQTAQTPSSFRPACFFERAAASIIDHIIIFIPAVIFTFLLNQIITHANFFKSMLQLIHLGIGVIYPSFGLEIKPR